MGYMYDKGMGVPQDIGKAKKPAGGCWQTG